MQDSTMTMPRKRGGCLTAMLLLMMVVNPLIGIYYLTAGDAVKDAVPDLPDWALPVLIVLSFVNFICAIGIWMWKKIGFYGFVGTSIVAAIINLISIGPGQAFFGLIGLGILGFLVRPIWDDLE
ncbi:MAG: hypothetical protein K8L91_01220 [Anaerolineae bacterium]|nr:hypothetical protein [Anaerolineae bacterium]